MVPRGNSFAEPLEGMHCSFWVPVLVPLNGMIVPAEPPNIFVVGWSKMVSYTCVRCVLITRISFSAWLVALRKTEWNARKPCSTGKDFFETICPVFLSRTPMRSFRVKLCMALCWSRATPGSQLSTTSVWMDPFFNPCTRSRRLSASCLPNFEEAHGPRLTLNSLLSFLRVLLARLLDKEYADRVDILWRPSGQNCAQIWEWQRCRYSKNPLAIAGERAKPQPNRLSPSQIES